MRKLPIKLTGPELKLGLVYWALQLLVLPAALPMAMEHFGWDWTPMEQNFVFFVLNFGILLLILHKFVFASCLHGITHPFRTLRFAFFGFVLYYLSSIGISHLIGYLHPEFANVNDASFAPMVAEEYTLAAIGTVVLVPVAEELMYRGLIFGGLHDRSPLLAYLVSTALFAAIHVMGYIGAYDPLTLGLCFLQYVPAGLFLARAYLRSGSILTPILIHAAVNQIAISSMR